MLVKAKKMSIKIKSKALLKVKAITATSQKQSYIKGKNHYSDKP